MAHTGIFATSDEIIFKAGADYNSTAATEARINSLCLQVEGFINSVTRYNWNDVYSTLNADVRGILAEAESNLVAVYLIQHDMNGYLSKSYAMDMVRNLLMRFNDCIMQLLDKKREEFMTNA